MVYSSAPRLPHQRSPLFCTSHHTILSQQGYVEGGWRALAERSKKLAHKAAGGASAATSSPHVIPAAATRATHAAAKAAPAHSGSGAGKRGAGGGRARRPRSRRSRSHGESWETEIRKDSLPIVCECLCRMFDRFRFYCGGLFIAFGFFGVEVVVGWVVFGVCGL